MSQRTSDLVFFLLVLLLSSWHLDDSRGDNSVSRAAMTAAIVNDGTLCIDRYETLTKDKAKVGDHYYSEKAPLPALLVVPFLAIGNWAGLLPVKDGLPSGLVGLGGFLCGSFPFALIVYLMMVRLRSRGALPFPRTISVIALFGSFLFVQSGSFFGHLLAALFVILAMIQRENGHPFPSGLWIGAAVLCEYTMVIFPLVWLVHDAFSGRWKAFGSIILGGLPSALLLLCMNALITGNPFSLPYGHVAEYGEARGLWGIIAPSGKALFGLVWGSYRGLLYYAPLTVLALVAMVRVSQRPGPLAFLLHPFALPCLLLILLISAHTMWWGGWSFGPRHITVIAALLLFGGLPLVPDRSWTRWTFVLLGLLGLLLCLGAKNTVWGAFPSDVIDPIRTILLPSLMNGSWTTMQWPVTLGFTPAASSGTFVFIFVAVILWCVRTDRRTQQI